MHRLFPWESKGNRSCSLPQQTQLLMWADCHAGSISLGRVRILSRIIGQGPQMTTGLVNSPWQEPKEGCSTGGLRVSIPPGRTDYHHRNGQGTTHRFSRFPGLSLFKEILLELRQLGIVRLSTMSPHPNPAVCRVPAPPGRTKLDAIYTLPRRPRWWCDSCDTQTDSSLVCYKSFRKPRLNELQTEQWHL